MKKLLMSMLALIVLAGVAFAYPTSTGDVDDTPQTGLWKTDLSANQKKGALCVIGGAEFRYVLNATTQESQGHPAFFNFNGVDDYQVGPFASTASYEAFAGLWYCDGTGSSTIAKDAYGWIQTRGVGYGYVSIEASNAYIPTSVAAGTILTGTTEVGGDRANITNGYTIRSQTAGKRFLIPLRILSTSTIISNTGGLGSTNYIVNPSIQWPKALDAYSTTTSGRIRIFIRP